MHIYKIGTNHLDDIKEHPFKLEKEMQTLFETNLTNLTGLNIVKSEFSLKQFRFDTLAFDHEKQAFVVIEYKRDKSQSVIDQGVSYLNAMLDYKDSLIIEYNEQNISNPLKRSDIDWSQTRIIFVANSFNDYQRNATNFKNLGIELIEFKRYQNNLLTVNNIERSKHAPSLKESSVSTANSNPSTLEKISKEIIEYDEEYHLSGKSEEAQELFEKVKTAILAMNDDISLNFNKHYVTLKKDKSNIVDIIIQKYHLKIYINAQWGELDDPKNLFRNVKGIGHLGMGDYELVLKDTQQLEYILSVIKQKIL